MKARLLSIFSILLMSFSILAHNLEPLHVDGRYLKNPNGDIVTLHGYVVSLDSWFQAEDFKFENYDFQAAIINKKAALDSVLATGWKMDYVRFIFPDYYCYDKGPGYKGFNLGFFKKYLDEFCLPLIDYYHENGIYTILLPPIAPPTLIENGDEYQHFLLLLWDCLSSHPRIRNNSGILFELANEPVNFNGKYSCYNGLDSYYLNSRTPFKEFKDYWQPIVDKIRSHCSNVIYVPGLLWQSDFTGFADYPITGDNIGYAIHWYPGWWSNLRKDWEEHVAPLAYMAPFVMTETGWGIGDIAWGTTTNFGKPLKEIVDDLGNVSWDCWEAYEDYYYLVNDMTSKSEKAIMANDPEVYYKPLYQWWNDYANTKVMPIKQLKANNVLFDDFPTTVSPGKYGLAKIKAEFTNGLSWDVSGDAEYTVSDESVLTIKNGIIRARKEGTTTVGISYTDGIGQTFSRNFTITSTIFPLTNHGFNPDLTTKGNSFEESNGTFSSDVWTMGGWTFCDGVDLSSYKNLVIQLHEPPQYGASVHIWDTFQTWDDENGGWNSACDPISEQPGFDFGGSTELVVGLQNLKNKKGQPLDLSHICQVAINVNAGTVRIKNVFLSNDGIIQTPYVGEPVVVSADNKTIFYGDDLSDLTYSVSGCDNNGTPTLSTTANSTSPVGTYPITIGHGTVSDDHTNYQDGNVYILPAPLEVTINDSIINEGETPSHFTYSGFKNGDKEDNVLINHPVAIARENITHEIVTAIDVLPAGSYIMSGRDGKADNYELCCNAATLTIKELPVEGTNLTDRVGVSQDDWHAWATAGWCPPVKTSDGREVSLCETYENTTADVGERMWQEINDLPNGEYVVEVFANAIYKSDQGLVESSIIEGADDVAYVEANGKRTYLRARFGDILPWSHLYRINTLVSDGTLRISLVVEKPGTNWHTIQIKRLVKRVETNLIDEDMTARVDTSQEAWNAWGVCATEFAPVVTTNDGRQAQMMESYEETTENTGEMMHQVVSGLENGDYAVELYANALYTDGRGFASGLKDGAMDVAYVSANDRRCYISSHIGSTVSENGVYTVYAHVTDGTLRIGLTAEKSGTNWHTIQIKKLTLLRHGTVIYADDKEREQEQSNPEWTYTLSGADITGYPTLTCMATKQSSPGCYVIKVERGTAESDLPIYLQSGVLTVIVPSNINGVKADNSHVPVYDLQGRRVANPTKGIYIIGGHKVVKIM